MSEILLRNSPTADVPVAPQPQRPAELFLRDDAVFTDVNFPKRMIELIAVPWDQETDVLWRGEIWREVFRRGAFNGIEDHAGRVRVNREHRKGDTVGKVVRFDASREEGLIAHVKVVAGDDGDRALNLAAEDMVSASVGYYVKTPGADVRVNKRTKVREVLRAFLDHLSLVESPAFEGARVLAVNEDRSGLATVDTPLSVTPLLDELMNDDLLAWASSRAPR